MRFYELQCEFVKEFPIKMGAKFLTYQSLVLYFSRLVYFQLLFSRNSASSLCLKFFNIFSDRPWLFISPFMGFSLLGLVSDCFHQCGLLTAWNNYHKPVSFPKETEISSVKQLKIRGFSFLKLIVHLYERLCYRHA